MKHPFHLLALCMLTLSSCGQSEIWGSHPTDTEEWGLKGKIKSCIIYEYDSIKLVGEAYFPTDTTNWIRKVIVSSKIDGNTENVQIFNGGFSQLDVTNSVISYSYSKNGRTAIQKEKEDTLTTYTKLWTSDTSYLEELFDKNRKLMTRSTVTFLRQKNIRVQEDQYFDIVTGEVDNNATIKFLFDRAGHLDSTIRIDAALNETVEIAQELQFDKKGNAIKTLKQEPYKNGKYLILKQFEYWQ